MATNFKSSETEDEVETREYRECPGEDLAGVPEEDKDDCKPHFTAERHKFTERGESASENSPSTGWRGVYYQMGVDLR